MTDCNCQIKYSPDGRGSPILYLPKAYAALVRRVRRTSLNFSHIVVPHNNATIVPLAWLISRAARCKLIVDAFDPAYQTALMKGRGIWEARTRLLVERASLRLADHVLVTTESFKQLYVSMHGIEGSRVWPIPPGADEVRFRPVERSGLNSDYFTVLYWGKFHPHHGARFIVDAAGLLQHHSEIRFVMAGDGTEASRMRRHAEEQQLSNIRFLGFVSDEELMQLIADAHVCLGIFSKHVCAQASITNKVSEALAMGKAVVTSESPATLSTFTHKRDLYLVPPEDPEALAAAILELSSNPSLREGLEEGGQQAFESTLSEQVIARQLAELLDA